MGADTLPSPPPSELQLESNVSPMGSSEKAVDSTPAQETPASEEILLPVDIKGGDSAVNGEDSAEIGADCEENGGDFKENGGDCKENGKVGDKVCEENSKDSEENGENGENIVEIGRNIEESNGIGGDSEEVGEEIGESVEEIGGNIKENGENIVGNGNKVVGNGEIGEENGKTGSTVQEEKEKKKEEEGFSDLVSDFESAPAPPGSAAFLQNGSALLQSPSDPVCAAGAESGSSAAAVPAAEEESGWISAETGLPVVSSAPAAKVLPVAMAGRRFYLARIPRFVDNDLREKIRLAEIRLEESCSKRDQIRASLQLKRNSRAELIAKIKPARDRERARRDFIQQKRTELEPLQVALNSFRPTRDNRGNNNLCSSEAELDQRINSLRHRMEHESIHLSEEKQILKEIKRLEATRPQVCQYTISQAELIEKLGPKEDIQENCKSIGSELDVLRNDQKRLRAEVDESEKEIKVLNSEIEELRQLLEKADIAQQEAFSRCKELKKQENANNDEFYQNRRDIQMAKDHVFQNNFQMLEEHCHKQVERALELWNNNKQFRTSYIKNNERSTLRRLETLDGRSLGPGEERPTLASENEVFTASMPRSKESGSIAKPQAAVLSNGKTMDSKPLETKVVSKVTVAKLSTKEANPVTEIVFPSEKILELPKPVKLSLPVKSEEEKRREEAEAAELKEKQRQEEMRKAKDALERKKKQADKNLAKAQARAQKEAERKEKEKEKKARKKAAALASPSPSTTGATEEEGSNKDTGESPEGLSNSKASREMEVSRKAPTQRKPTPKAPKTASKVTLASLSKKKKKSYPTWVWASSFAVAVLLAAVAYIMMRSS